MMWLLVVSIVVLAGVALGYLFARRGARTPSVVIAAADVADEEVDDEIRGVFIAEMRNEIGSLRRNLPRWRMAPTDLERAVPLRRSFHTLKGGGRLVGAAAIGDFCASIERLLLCVVEKEVAPDPPVVDVVSRAVAMLPGLLGEFSGERTAGVDVRGLVKTAEHLAADKPAVPSSRRSAPPTSERKRPGAAH